LRGTAAEVAKELARRGTTKGEITVAVSGKSQSKQKQSPKANLVERITELTMAHSLEEKDALKQAAREFGLSKSEAYREWQRRKKSGER
jgi:16S rRNA (cytidine1402-2'-O)-methyltransferase